MRVGVPEPALGEDGSDGGGVSLFQDSSVVKVIPLDAVVQTGIEAGYV